MITLTFLVCLESGTCFASSPDTIFKTVEACEAQAMVVIQDRQQAAAEGKFDKHNAVFQCLDWGTPL